LRELSRTTLLAAGLASLLGSNAFAADAAADPVPPQTPAPAATPAAIPDETPDALYRKALDFYEHGEYALAAGEFQRLLYPPKPGMDPEKTRRAHLYRGISLFLLDEKPAADGEFWAVLLSDPDYAPDPLFTPPAVIAAFARLKRDNAGELRKVRVTRRRDDPPRDAMGIPIEPGGPGTPGEFWWSIAPFGVAQLHNGQPRKGYTLLAIEAPLLAANLSSWAAFEALKKDGGRFDEDTLDDARLLKNVNNATFALFVATLLYGTADGLWYGSLQSPKQPPPGTPVITPVGGPGQGGLQMTVRF
jgi:hypothetical protein